MAILNSGLLGNSRKKIGNIVTYVMEGKTVARAKAAKVKVSNSVAAVTQRGRFRNAVKFRQAYRTILDHSLQGTPYGYKTLQKWLSLALRQTAVVFPREFPSFVPQPYLLSSGSLPAIQVGTTTRVEEGIEVNRYAAPILWVGDGLDNKAKYNAWVDNIRENFGIEYGDQITIAYATAEGGVFVAHLIPLEIESAPSEDILANFSIMMSIVTRYGGASTDKRDETKLGVFDSSVLAVGIIRTRPNTPYYDRSTSYMNCDLLDLNGLISDGILTGFADDNLGYVDTWLNRSTDADPNSDEYLDNGGDTSSDLNTIVRTSMVRLNNMNINGTVNIGFDRAGNIYLIYKNCNGSKFPTYGESFTIAKKITGTKTVGGKKQNIYENITFDEAMTALQSQIPGIREKVASPAVKETFDNSLYQTAADAANQNNPSQAPALNNKAVKSTAFLVQEVESGKVKGVGVAVLEDGSVSILSNNGETCSPKNGSTDASEGHVTIEFDGNVFEGSVETKDATVQAGVMYVNMLRDKLNNKDLKVNAYPMEWQPEYANVFSADGIDGKTKPITPGEPG